MHHQRVGHQRAEVVELLVPVPRQLMQQGVGLGLAQLQLLEEVEHQSGLVEGEADDVDQVGDGEDNLQGKFAVAEHTGDLPVLVLGPR